MQMILDYMLKFLFGGMPMRTRIFSFVIVCILLLNISSISASAIAISPTEAANHLNGLGLFQGTNNGYELDRVPTRQEVLVMLIRLLGKESEVKNGIWSHPFKDVDDWASSYVGYAYQKEIAKGVSATSFEGTGYATAQQYTVFLLRALGYTEASNDFTWDSPFKKSDSIGLTDGTYTLSSQFNRGDVAVLSYTALGIRLKNNELTLLEYLKSIGAIQNADKLTATEIFKKASPAVFFIALYDSQANLNTGKYFASGSGFFVEASGVAFTNYHVIEGAKYAQITTSDGAIYNVSHVIHADAARDIAIIRVSKTSTTGKKVDAFTYLNLGNSADLQTGEVVYTIGSPKGLSDTMSNGIISNVNREISGYSYIQTTAPISPGSSGGVLLNERAQAIGITSAGFEGQNLNLAIPINEVKNISRTATGTAFETWYSSLPAPEYKITISPNTLNLKVGERGVAYISTDCPGSIMFEATIDNQSIVSAQWGEQSGQSLPLHVTALASGTAKITIKIVEGAGKATPSATLSIHVGGSGTTGIAGYPSYPSVPDFGAMTGTAPDYSKTDAFGYNLQTVRRNYGTQYEADYIRLLVNNGFQYYQSSKLESGETAIYYVNYASKLAVGYASAVDASGYEMFVIAIVELKNYAASGSTDDTVEAHTVEDEISESLSYLESLLQ